MTRRRGTGWLDIANLGVQLIQARKQGQMASSLDSQLTLKQHEMNQSQRIAKGRLCLIECEELIAAAGESFNNYPFYSIISLTDCKTKFNQVGLAGNFFAETDDIRHAKTIEGDLIRSLAEFSEKMPENGDITLSQIRQAFNVLNSQSMIQAALEADEFVNKNNPDELRREIVAAEKKAKEKEKTNRLGVILLLLTSAIISSGVWVWSQINETPLQTMIYFLLGLICLLSFTKVKQVIPVELSLMEVELENRQRTIENALSQHTEANTVEELLTLWNDSVQCISTHIPADQNEILPTVSF